MSFTKKTTTKKSIGQTKKKPTKKALSLSSFIGGQSKTVVVSKVDTTEPKRKKKVNRLDRFIIGTELVEKNEIDPHEVYNTPSPKPIREKIVQSRRRKNVPKPTLTPTKEAVIIKGETIRLEKAKFPKVYQDSGSKVTINIDENNYRVLTAKSTKNQYNAGLDTIIGKNGILKIEYKGQMRDLFTISAEGFLPGNPKDPKSHFRKWMKTMKNFETVQTSEGKNKYVFIVKKDEIHYIAEELRNKGLPLGHKNHKPTVDALEKIRLPLMQTNTEQLNFNAQPDSSFVTIKTDKDDLLKRIGEYLYSYNVVVQDEFVGVKKNPGEQDDVLIYRADDERKPPEDQVGKKGASRKVIYELVKPVRAKTHDGQEYIVAYRIPITVMNDYAGEIANKFNTPVTITDQRNWEQNEPREIFIDDKFTGFREYQIDAINEVLWKGQGLIQAATGAGKTEIGIGILAGINKDAVWFTHKNDLVLQSEERIESRLGMDVGKITGTSFEIIETPGMDVNILSIQSVYSAINALDAHERGEKILKPKELAKKRAIIDLIGRADVQIYDEAHHLKANTFKAVTEIAEQAPHKIGLTATPYNKTELDRKTIEVRIGQPIIRITASELIDKKFLAQPDIKQLVLPPGDRNEDLWNAYQQASPQQKGALYQVVKREAIVRNATANAIKGKHIAKQQKKGESSLVLVNRREHAEILSDMMRMAGADMTKVVVNTGETIPDSFERKKVLDDFKAGVYKTMIATDKIAGEGVDIPKIDNVFLAHAEKGYIPTMQMTGRGLRRPKGSGKTKVNIWDYQHPEPMINAHGFEREKIWKSEPAFKFERVPLREISQYVQ